MCCEFWDFDESLCDLRVSHDLQEYGAVVTGSGGTPHQDRMLDEGREWRLG